MECFKIHHLEIERQAVNMESSSSNQLRKPALKTRIVIPPTQTGSKRKAGKGTVKLYSFGPSVKKQRLPSNPVTKKQSQPRTKMPQKQPQQQPQSTTMAEAVKAEHVPAKTVKIKPAPTKAAPTEPVPTDDPLKVLNTWMILLTKSRVGPTSPLDILRGYCWQQFWWKTIVRLTNSLERYTSTLDCVMELGTCSEVQQQVLEVFTRDVCAQHLPIATAVWDQYTKKLNSQAANTAS